MAFYYVTFSSAIFLGVVYVILALLFSATAFALRRVPNRGLILGTIGSTLLVLPVSEELWIAWNFEGACRSAGSVIHKIVHTEGFYDDVFPWREPRLLSSRYRFVESRDRVTGALLRVERIGSQVRLSQIERPSAQYHFRSSSHVRIAHKVVMNKSTIRVAGSGEVMASETNYGRYGPWFYIGLDPSVKLCRGTSAGKRLLYERVLLPASDGTRTNK